MGAGYRLREAHQAAANPTPPNHPTHLGERESRVESVQHPLNSWASPMILSLH